MKLQRNINYINRGFEGFLSQLKNYTQTYFPNTYSDFSSTSPGMLFMEQSAYVGDVLSFYLDKQIQENFINYAQQVNNIYEMAYMYGYKPKTTGLSNVDVDFYQLLPSININGEMVPDYNYAVIIKENSQISSTSGINFNLSDSVDFSVSSSIDPTTVTIAQTSNGSPTFFLLKKTRKARSGNINTIYINFGEYTEYPTININNSNIAGVLDVIDSNKNIWYEVDYLGQELIFEGEKNVSGEDPDAPYILDTKQVQHRFATRFINPTTLQLQFGSGNSNYVEEDIIPNPNNIGLGLPSQESKLTTAYSPTNFMFTNTYGIAPTNTTLTIRYITGGGVESNIEANTLTNLNLNNTTFVQNGLDPTLSSEILNSVAINNPTPANGGDSGDSLEEIKLNSISNFSSQLRAVTSNDYLIRTLSLPPKYGIIAKALAQKPKVDEGYSTLDIYTLTYDINKNLKVPSNTLKNNLKTYLDEYKMIGDKINIKNGYIINIGISFDILTFPNAINNEVLAQCILELQEYFNIDNWQINQPIILRELYILLDKVKGVQTVKNVEIIPKYGVNKGYSMYTYDIKGATRNGVIYPSLDPSIFEVKYPNNDIKGKCVSF